jgi:hypothetical protein
MASTELSRRVEKLVGYHPLSDMSDDQRRDFHESLLDADTFEDLPGKWQAAILNAEQTGRSCGSCRTPSPLPPRGDPRRATLAIESPQRRILAGGAGAEVEGERMSEKLHTLVIEFDGRLRLQRVSGRSGTGPRGFLRQPGGGWPRSLRLVLRVRAEPLPC